MRKGTTARTSYRLSYLSGVHACPGVHELTPQPAAAASVSEMRHVWHSSVPRLPPWNADVPSASSRGGPTPMQSAAKASRAHTAVACIGSNVISVSKPQCFKNLHFTSRLT